MLWTLFVILLVLWLVGVVSSYTFGGFIHILLVLSGDRFGLPAHFRTKDKFVKLPQHAQLLRMPGAPSVASSPQSSNDLRNRLFPWNGSRHPGI